MTSRSLCALSMMMIGLPGLLILAFSGVPIGAAPLATLEPVVAPPTRTFYFAARDANGAPVVDLTAADLTLIVGGKIREIVDVRRATEPIDAALVVNDGGTGVFAALASAFIQQMLGYGRFSVFALDKQPTKLLAFTSDAEAIQFALRRLGRRGPASMPADLIEVINDAAKALWQVHAARPVIVVFTTGGESLDERGTDVAASARAAMNAVQRCGASLNVMMDQTREVGTVLGQGPLQSGGINVAIGDQGLTLIRQTLLNQYALTYVSPDVKRADAGLVLRTARGGVKFTAPDTVSPSSPW